MRILAGLFFATLLVAVLPQATLASSSVPWPYLQIYPPVNETDSRTPLYFAVVLTFSGAYTSIAALPGVQIALDYINSHPSILPGYTLHYTLIYSECNVSGAFDTFLKQINSEPTKVGWVGSGCSIATEPTAELTQFYNITQVSCVSSSPDLSNRQRYRYFFMLLDTEEVIAQGFLGIIEHFRWRRVSIIVQDEKIFTATVRVLKEELSERGIEHVEKRFRTEDGISGITTDHFEPEFRVFVLLMYSDHARDLFCEAYRRGLHYPEFMMITYGWYLDEWWTGPATSDRYNCTAEERATLLPYTLAPLQREYPADLDAEAEPNINASWFRSEYSEAANKDINQDINLKSYTEEFFLYSYHCHEATIAFAYALNQTIADLNENSTLNREAAEQNNLHKGENFTMANFTYKNSVVVSRMFEHLENTMFDGVSGNKVMFNENGTREVDTVAILQYQFNISSGDIIRTEVATVSYSGGIIQYNSSDTSPAQFPNGIPSDGIPMEEVVTVSVPLTVVYVILATAGLVFAAVCLIFTLIFRQRRLIRLSSPNLNYIIGLGAIILYLNVITFVIPTDDADFAAVLCNINPWLTSLGYSLCYGTILIKMFRVWIIFSRPQKAKTPLLQDHYMALFVLCLVIIDFIILGVYTMIEAIRGNLGVKRIVNREMPEETIGSTAVVHKYFLYVCESDGQVIVYAFLYGYKGLLQVIALILAFSTRKIKVKGLNDSKYIAAAIYITSIVLAVTTVSTYTLMDYVNVYPAVVGIGFLLGTTMILGLVFVPRMVGLYKDPDGKKITFLSSVGNRSIGAETNDQVKQLQRKVSELESSLRKYAPGEVLSNDVGSPSYQLELSKEKTDKNPFINFYENKPSNGSSHPEKTPSTI